MVAPPWLEQGTCRLWVGCSNQLSYGATFLKLGLAFLLLPLKPAHYESDALTNWAMGPYLKSLAWKRETYQWKASASISSFICLVTPRVRLCEQFALFLFSFTCICDEFALLSPSLPCTATSILDEPALLASLWSLATGRLLVITSGRRG